MQLSDGGAELVRLVRARGAATRSEIGVVTGWARTTVNARLDETIDAGLVHDVGSHAGSRGRPAARFAFAPTAGSLLIADVGASAARLAHCDLDGSVLSQARITLDIGDGPDAVLGAVVQALDGLPSRQDVTPVWAAGISLPGPIEQPEGRVVSPPIMTGWDGLVVPEVLGPALGVPVIVENDANAMAWGEHVRSRARLQHLVLVKIGTGIGAGVVMNGGVVRGAEGGAGDLGHTSAFGAETEDPAPWCRCGKTGCIEAYAGGWAIARDLQEEGVDAAGVADVVALVAAGDAHAIRLVRQAGRVLGAGLASAVSLLNPSEIIVAGPLAVAGEHLLSGIREHVAARSLPLATRRLVLRVSDDPHEVGVTGMVDEVIRWSLSDDNLPGILARSSSEPTHT